MSSDDLLDLAVDAAHDAGRLLLEHARAPAREVGTKSTPTDLVSEADRASEELVLGRIREARPDDGILAEEGGRASSGTGLVWIVDPLDGTVNFLFGLPQWAVSIACEDPDGGLVGVIHDPCRGETFTAVRGDGARLDSEPIRVSDKAELAQALVATGFAYDARVRAEQAETVARALPLVRDVRRFGSAALDLAWTACGRFDGYYESAMGPWDKAAGTLLVREAGGIVSELSAPLDSDDHGVLAAGPALHDALRELVVG